MGTFRKGVFFIAMVRNERGCGSLAGKGGKKRKKIKIFLTNHYIKISVCVSHGLRSAQRDCATALFSMNGALY
jgi:hypothetical protein